MAHLVVGRAAIALILAFPDAAFPRLARGGLLARKGLIFKFVFVFVLRLQRLVPQHAVRNGNVVKVEEIPKGVVTGVEKISR